MFDFINPEVVGISLAAAFSIVCLSAICSGPWFVAFNEAGGMVGKKVFLDKCAYQSAKLCLYLFVAFVPAMSAQFYFIGKQQVYLWEGPYRLPLIVLGSLFGTALLLSMVHVFTWNSLRKLKTLHWLIGFAAALCLSAALLFSGMLVRTLLHSGPPLTDKASLWELVLELFERIPATSMLWPMLGQSVLLGFGAIGALSMAWMIVMRKRDDFGRDYYNFALSYCAYWAIGGTLGSLGMSVLSVYEGWRGMAPDLSQIPPGWLMAVAAVLPSLACLLWFLIIKSSTPMRHKFGVWLALLFLILSISAQILVANEIMPAS